MIKILQKIANTLPFGKSLISALILIPIARRLKREKKEFKVLEFKMNLDVYESIDSALIFYPSRFDRHEINYLKKVLVKGSIFIDAGSHIGFYSMNMSKVVGETGRIIAIEAYPSTFKTLLDNIRINKFVNIFPLNIGLSDKKETLDMKINLDGNLSANSFITEHQGGEFMKIECMPLKYILEENKINRIDALKIDIEGFEFKVLNQFFKTVANEIYPKHIIIEHNLNIPTTGDAIALLKSFNYEVVWSKDINFIMRLNEKV